MIRIYRAANLQDAHIVLGLLENEGLHARLLNAAAQGALGEIPFAQTYPELWVVDRDVAARARVVIERFEHGPRSLGVRDCPSCKEQSPENFECCWSCGADLS